MGGMLSGGCQFSLHILQLAFQFSDQVNHGLHFSLFLFERSSQFSNLVLQLGFLAGQPSNLVENAGWLKDLPWVDLAQECEYSSLERIQWEAVHLGVTCVGRGVDEGGATN